MNKNDIPEEDWKWWPDCGDSLCRFALEKTGQRTNGGCRCLPPNCSSSVKIAICFIIEENDRLRKELEECKYCKYCGKKQILTCSGYCDL